MLFKIGIFDSLTNEKFGDTLTGICTIIREQPIQRFSMTDKKLIEELKKQSSTTKQIDLDFFNECDESDDDKKKKESNQSEAQEKVDMID